MIKLITCLVFLNLPLFATMSDMPRQFDKVQNDVKRVGVPANSCCESFQTYSAATYGYFSGSCIRSICGSATETSSLIVKNQAAKEKVAKKAAQGSLDFPSQIENKFSQIKKLVKEENDLLTSKLEDALADPNFKISGSAKAFYNFSIYSQNLNKVAFKFDSLEIDEIKTKAQLGDLTPEQQKMVLAGAKAFSALSIGTRNEKSRVAKLPPALAIQSYFGEEDVEEGVRTALDKTKKALGEISSATPMLKDLLAGPTMTSMIREIETHYFDKTITEDEMRILFDMSVQFPLFASMFAKDSPFLQGPDIQATEMIRNAGGVTKMKSNVARQSDTANSKALYEIEECRSQFFLNHEILPTKDQVNQLRKDVSDVRNLVEKRVLSKYSKQTSGELKKILDPMQFIYPLSKDQFSKELEINLDQKIKLRQTGLESIRKSAPEELKGVILLKASNAGVATPDASENNNTFCGSFFYPFVNDANYTALGGIILSYSTATAPQDVRLKIISHEIGHTLFHSLNKSNMSDESRKFFAGQTECLADQHFPRSGRPKELYNNEDFADLVAMTATDSTRTNPWCQLVNVSGKTMNEMGYYEVALEDATPLDTHSTGLFRLLHYQLGTGNTLPRDCADFLAQNNEPAKFKSCFSLPISK